MDEALTEARRLAKLTPKLLSAAHVALLAAAGLGDYAGAADAARRCMAIAPARGFAHMLISDIAVVKEAGGDAAALDVVAEVLQQAAKT